MRVRLNILNFLLPLVKKFHVMKKLVINFMVILLCLSGSGITYGQWVGVKDNVTPVDIAISPIFNFDQTVYILDDEQRLYISESGGLNWVLLYEALDPTDPAQTVLDIILSPNFKNDNAIIMLHKDGTAELSYDRGQHWITFPVPDGTTGIVYSPKVMEDYKMFAITGAYGPVKFYKSLNGGATWTFVSDLGLGGGFYCRLWNSSDTAAVNNMAVLYDNQTVYLTKDAGVAWKNSFSAQVSVRDLVFSPRFSDDSTIFIADASEIYKNEEGGNELSWVNVGTYAGSFGIKFAISTGYQQDQTIFAAVDKVGIIRSTNGGFSWEEFNDGFGSDLPISIAISQNDPYTLFAGSMQTGGEPDKLWRFQTSSGTSDQNITAKLAFRIYPNPFTDLTQITFETPSAGRVQLTVYDITGKKLKVLLSENLDKGLHHINLNSKGLNLNPGVYFCSLEAEDHVVVQKVLVN
jgi:hypothetical protein